MWSTMCMHLSFSIVVHFRFDVEKCHRRDWIASRLLFDIGWAFEFFRCTQNIEYRKREKSVDIKIWTEDEERPTSRCVSACAKFIEINSLSLISNANVARITSLSPVRQSICKKWRDRKKEEQCVMWTKRVCMQQQQQQRQQDNEASVLFAFTIALTDYTLSGARTHTLAHVHCQ